MNDTSGWGGLSSSDPYSTDNANLQQSQGLSNILAGAGTGYSDPSIQGQMSALQGNGQKQMPSYAQPSQNGYPVFSSQTAGVSSPSGYASTNPIDSTPSVIATQARGMAPPMPLQNSNPVTPPTSNPWNIKTSSQSGSFDYPMGQGTPPPKLNVM